MLSNINWSFIIPILLIWSAQSVQAEEIFADLQGEKLIEEIRKEYSPKKVHSPEQARFELFNFVDQTNRKVRLPYTGRWHQITGIPNPKFITSDPIWPEDKIQDPVTRKKMSADLHQLFPCYQTIKRVRATKSFGKVTESDQVRWHGSSIP